MTDDLYEERRKLKRRHLVYYLKVFNMENDQLLGHLVDITAEGLMLVSDNPIEKGKTYQLRMMLPQEVRSKEEIQFSAESLWRKQDANPDLLVTGLKITDISEEDQLIIESLIRRHGFQD